jgi:hypothetical protein
VFFLREASSDFFGYVISEDSGKEVVYLALYSASVTDIHRRYKKTILGMDCATSVMGRGTVFISEQPISKICAF